MEPNFFLCVSAVFLLDVGNEVYVWEGWMPTEFKNDKRGSAKRRWDEERKLTLQTAMSYVEGIYIYIYITITSSCFYEGAEQEKIDDRLL